MKRAATITVCQDDGSAFRMDGSWDDETGHFEVDVDRSAEHAPVPDEERFANTQEVHDLAGKTIVKAWVSPEEGVILAARLTDGKLLELKIEA